MGGVNPVWRVDNSKEYHLQETKVWLIVKTNILCGPLDRSKQANKFEDAFESRLSIFKIVEIKFHFDIVLFSIHFDVSYTREKSHLTLLIRTS